MQDFPRYQHEEVDSDPENTILVKGISFFPSYSNLSIGIQEWKQVETTGVIPAARCWFGYCVLKEKLWIFGGEFIFSNISKYLKDTTEKRMQIRSLAMFMS
jgi:hypothetical protein